MRGAPLEHGPAVGIGILLGSWILMGLATQATAQVRFTDDFSGDLSGWHVRGARAIEIRESGDPSHGAVLVLNPDGWDVYALIRGSDQWGTVRIEGDVFFPDDEHNYLGVLYNFTRTGSRTDFGNIYIKGNGSYLRMNPHRDGNVSRILYEELRTPLTGEAAIRIGEWQRFALEVMDNVAHFYVGNMDVPQVTFDLFEGSSGLVGFQPRSVGAPVWIDNIQVTSVDGLSYDGVPVPEGVSYEPDELLTDWEVIGPLSEHDDAVARGEPGTERRWRPFDVDARGAVVTGRVVEYAGSRTVAYFRTTLHSDREQEVLIGFGSADNFALWFNGRFAGFVSNTGGYAWYDFWKNPEREQRRGRFTLQPGENHVVVRVQGGQYATGGFFARVAEPEEGDGS
jgi:hypothetical protein